MGDDATVHRGVMRVAIFDYGVGNLHSLAKALSAPGVGVSISAEPFEILGADAIVLPGVGSFGAAAARLAPARAQVAQALAEGMRCLGVCLGMQLLFEHSDESPDATGLGVIPGSVRRLQAKRVPHMGWNRVDGSVGLDVAYFAHSYVCQPADEQVVTAWTVEDGDRFPSAVRWRNVVGVQFHPEKSSTLGLRFMRSWLAQ
jgi:imidazole glycerol-phosphate synthase subunit HisH